MSSKPTTAMSAGTRIPAVCSSRMAPIAIWSLAQTIASGSSRRGRVRISRTASWPLIAANRPWKDPASVAPGCPATASSKALRRSRASGASGRAGYAEQPGPAVLFDQMADQRLGAGAVVGAEDVGVRLVGGTGDQHDRDARRQPRQML